MSLRVKTMRVGLKTWSVRMIGGLLLLFYLVSFQGSGKANVAHAASPETFPDGSPAEGIIGIAGVATIVQDPDLQTTHRDQLPTVLAMGIKNVHPELEFISLLRLRPLVDEEKLDQIMKIYEAEGELGTDAVNDLFNASRDVVRYVILARVEQDAVSNQEVEDPGDDADDRPRTYYITRRKMSISFKVYDLETTRQVLATVITRDAANSDYIEDLTIGTDEVKTFKEAIGSMICSCLCGLVLDLFQKSDEDPYPPPPEVSEVAAKIFDAFAHDLPGHIVD